MREHLTAQLDRRVRAHGLVVWSDPEQEYAGVWSSLVPEGVRTEAFEGSWYELRRRIEAAVGGEAPPKLVVYAPASPPDEDPLAELRKAAGRFKLRLATLARQSLKQRLSAARIDEIAGAARTLEQAEAAAEGAGDADVRLVGVLGATDPASMLVEVLTGAADARLDSRAPGEQSRTWRATSSGLLAPACRKRNRACSSNPTRAANAARAKLSRQTSCAAACFST